MTSSLPLYFAYVIGAIVIIVPLGLMLFLKHFQRKDSSDDVKSLVCMMVSLPKDAQRSPSEANQPIKDFKQMIAPMEQFYSGLTTIIHQRHFVDWLFSTPAHVSFELTSVGGVISFVIICPKRIRSIVERQLHSYFPNAEIVLGAPPQIFSQENSVVSGAVFEQAKSFVLPLRTYNYLEADPLNGLSTVLTKLNGHAASIQLLIRPISENWRTQTVVASNHVAANRLHMVSRGKFGRLVGTVGEAVGPNRQVSPGPKPLSAMQQELSKALQEKGAKTGFEVILRIIASAKDQPTADEDLATIVSSFAQFYSPQLNSFKYRKSSGAKIAKDYLLRWFGNAPKMILNVEEISTIFHFPNRNLDTPGIKWLVAKSLPGPANLPEEGIVIGESNYRGVKKLVRMKTEDRRRHLFMIGKTGVGKTTLFETMIEQDIHEGRGVCFIDPLGDAIESIIKKIPTNRANDVILFDPSDTAYPMGLNLLEWQKPEEKDFLIQEVIEIFYKLFDPGRTGIVGPQWEHWARNAALTVMSQPGGGTLIDIPRLFTDDAFRTQAVAHVVDPVVKSFWNEQLAKTADFHKSEMYNYFISKFGRFMTNDLMRNIIGQPKSSFNFREVMDSGKILLVNLAKGKIGEINSDLIGLIMISKLQVAAFGRADIEEEKRRDFYLYVDEFQNFSTDTFATILAEARKYRLNLNITNQYFAQLSEKIKDAVVGNIGTLIAYRVGAEDAEFLVHELPGISVEDLTNLDRFQAYAKLLVDLTPTKPFSLKGIKNPSVGSVEMAQWIRNANRKKYSRSAITIVQGALMNQPQ